MGDVEPGRSREGAELLEVVRSAGFYGIRLAPLRAVEVLPQVIRRLDAIVAFWTRRADDAYRTW